MSIWWLNQVDRGSYEKEEIVKLQESVDFLKNVKLNLGDGNLQVEFDIVLKDKAFELVLSYPVVFPDAPPLVKTRDGKRVSGHQYGAEGELCLEYRPENWQPNISGAMMIESAYRLLSGENSDDEAQVDAVIDGHIESVGQSVRTEIFRFILTVNDLEGLGSIEENHITSAQFQYAIQNVKMVARLAQIGLDEKPDWVSASKFSEAQYSRNCFVLSLPARALSKSPTVDDVFEVLTKSDNWSAVKSAFETGSDFYLISKINRRWSMFWVRLETDKPYVSVFQAILDESQQQRLPDRVLQLGKKRIGIVGCGSLGSKVAAQLVRSEIGFFILIDDDILFEGNVVRNELAIGDIGFHKTLALSSHLKMINPLVDVETRQIRLGGQESSSATVSVMEQLASCDLIVDASADDRSFNIVASVAKSHKIPVVWGSVFAGGIGGLLGRSRPELDPIPLEARQQVKRWCDSQPVAEVAADDDDHIPYGILGEDGEPEIATDSDVSVMASYVASMVLDTLNDQDDSVFPNSAYAIGLEKKWCFTAPFDIRPISYTGPVDWNSGTRIATPEELAAFLEDLLPAGEG